MGKKEKKEKKKKHYFGKLMFLLIIGSIGYIGFKYFRLDIARFLRSKLDTAVAEEPVGTPTPTPYDYHGVTIKCCGGEWDNLDSDKEVYKKAKNYIEKKYNVVLTKSDLIEKAQKSEESNLVATLKRSIEEGEPLTDIINMDSEYLYAAYYADMFPDVTEFADKLEIGKSFVKAGTWKNKIYGISYDEKRNNCLIIYDRLQIAELEMEEPSKLFVEGKWNYDQFEIYLREMKEKLPEGVYPIGLNPYEWLSMASGANGSVLFDNEGKINLNDEAVMEAVRFYQKLESEGLAYPMSAEYDDFLGCLIGFNYVAGLDSDEIVLKTAYTADLPEDVSKYGIVYWPWGYNIKCDDYYLTLPDNYYIPSSEWTIDAPLKVSCEKLQIEPEIMTRIIYDYYSICREETVDSMHRVWKKEMNGETVVDSTTEGFFKRNRDNILFEWASERFTPDFSAMVSSFRDAGYETLCGYADPEEIFEEKQIDCEMEVEDPFVIY